ncbi:hypothetical protein GMMP15_940040 [Candidatus Magnetomoraceae bacterium gMMP-15]
MTTYHRGSFVFDEPLKTIKNDEKSYSRKVSGWQIIFYFKISSSKFD